ncbi:MAG TPA: hypothetical protein VNT26_24920, partial [Candidatus Sulfotelmatobacter sp.]|nr:hypothetical protein [Candidatus Sulfotelmatobacter sp.]
MSPSHGVPGIPNTPEQVAFRNARGGEHNVITLHQVLKPQDRSWVRQAHGLAPKVLLLVLGLQTGLHVATEAFERRSRQHAFRCAADAQQNIHARLREAGRDRWCNVTIRDQLNS